MDALYHAPIDRVFARNTKDKQPYANFYGASVSGLTLPGDANNDLARTDDSAAISIPGDQEVRCRIAANDYTPPAYMGMVSHEGPGFPVDFGFFFRIQQTTGLLEYAWSEDGITPKVKVSSAPVPAADGSIIWVRATLDVDNGAVQNEVKFYTSLNYNPADGTGLWTQLGTTQVTAGVTSVWDSAKELEIGRLHHSAWPFIGRIYYMELRNGINGPVVSRFDPANRALRLNRSFVAAPDTGETWTIYGQSRFF